VIRLGGDGADSVDGDALNGGNIEPVAAHAIGVEVNQGAQLATKRGELLCVQIKLEDAVLHVSAIALEQLHDLGATLIYNHVVADDREHWIILYATQKFLSILATCHAERIVADDREHWIILYATQKFLSILATCHAERIVADDREHWIRDMENFKYPGITCHAERSEASFPAS
jgi:hypothetical protein